MNFSRGAFPMQNPKLAGQSGLNTSIHQREHFVRPIKYLWMREIEQMFGTYLVYDKNKLFKKVIAIAIIDKIFE